MRAYEIALACLILQASIVFVGALDIFESSPYYVEKPSEYTQWTINETLGNISDTQYLGRSESGIYVLEALKSIAEGAKWLLQALFWFIKIVFSIILIYPTLVNVFGVPSELSALIQVAIVPVYIFGWLSWKSNKSSKYMD